jgi:uncharacterized membrane protein
VAGLVLAVVTLAVTIAGNIPLNEALAQGGTRKAFENTWTVWNLVRTGTALASFLCLLRA